MNHFKLIIENLDNGNYLVTVYKDKQEVIQRSYQNLGDAISLVPLVFEPIKRLRKIQESGKDAEE
jgi:hypothetical protein